MGGNKNDFSIINLKRFYLPCSRSRDMTKRLVTNDTFCPNPLVPSLIMYPGLSLCLKLFGKSKAVRLRWANRQDNVLMGSITLAN